MVTSDYTGPNGTHGECWNLLPWIANESVPPKELARFEAHLRDCKECREELEFQRQLRNTIRAEDAVVLAPQTSLQKLMQRIDGLEEKQSGDTFETGHEGELRVATAVPPLRRPRRRTSWLAIAAAVQGIAILGLLSTLWLQSRQTLMEPRYTMLTTAAAVAEGPVIRVVFAGGTALGEINGMLRSIDAQIVAGPSEAGVYTLSLMPRAPHESTIEQAVARLRGDGRVMFAELAVTSEAP